MRAVAAILALLAAAGQSVAIDSLVVGGRDPALKWRSIVDWDGTSRVTVTYDSIYRWDAYADQNIAPTIMDRGDGMVYAIYTVDDSSYMETLPALRRLIDGDPSTAFDPDDDPRIPRNLDIHIDLGDAFGIDHIRLYPRLDQENRQRSPQAFSIRSADIPGPGEERVYVSLPGLWFSHEWSNRNPVVDARFATRDMRYIVLRMRDVRRWEISEVEIYSDGTLPVGTYQSRPLSKHNAPYPVWVRARCDGRELTELPLTVHTRTGPDRYPILHYRLTGVEDELEKVMPQHWLRLLPEERGPRLPNPEWSSWEAVTDGVIHSPGLQPYLQFRVRLPESGTVLRRMVFEYVYPPIVHMLRAEIDPHVVPPGEEQVFTLSLLAHMRGGAREVASTGFRQIRVITEADIRGVDDVLVDDLPVAHVARHAEDGVTVNLGSRILEDGSFVQIRLRAAVFRDGTRFETRVLDRRVVDGRVQEMYQVAVEEDIDPVSAGGRLNVRFPLEDTGRSILANAGAVPRVFTPNGDGVHDVCEVFCDILALTRPGTARVVIHDLAGRRRRQLHTSQQVSGHFRQSWDGRDDGGDLVEPGIYLYRLTIEAQDRSDVHLGVLRVAY